MDLGPSDHHFNTYVNRDLSDIRGSTFNRAITIMERHVDASRLFDHDPTGNRKVGLWARVVGHDSTDFWKSDSANRIAKQTARILCGKSSLKTDVFSFSKKLLIES